MTDEIKIYKIRRRSDGLYSTGGAHPSFSKKGKTWDTLGHVSSHVGNNLGNYGDIKKSIPAYVDCELIEIIVRHEDSAKLDMAEYVERISRRKRIAKKHGSVLAELITDLEKKNLLETFRWCLVPRTFENQAFQQILVDRKIKKNQYRTRGNFYAFAEKDRAAMLRLIYTGTIESLDLLTMAEEF